jgi:hypothetical protein
MILLFSTSPTKTVPLSPRVRAFLDAMLSQFLSQDPSQSPSQQTIQVPGFCTAISLPTHLPDSISRYSRTRRRQTAFGPRVNLLLLPRRAVFVALGQPGAAPSRRHVLRRILESDPALLAKSLTLDFSSILARQHLASPKTTFFSQALSI